MCKTIDESKARPDVGCTELLDANSQRKLLQFARLFEPVHQEICKHGGTQVHEYMELWHVYKDNVRPILEASNAIVSISGDEQEYAPRACSVSDRQAD